MSRASDPEWSKQADSRRREMGLTVDEIVAIVSDPEATWPTHSGRRVYSGGRIHVVLNEASWVVVTVLHRSQEWYDRAA